MNSDHSLCSAVIGATAAARRMVAADASDRPMWRILPASISSFIAPTDSSIGTFVSGRWR